MARRTHLREDRRSKPRLPANEPGQVEWLDSKGERCALKINIRDMSEAGVGFSVVDKLRVGQTIWVSTDETTRCKAIVRHCREETGGFFVGAIRVLRERRRNERGPAGGVGTLHWEASGGGQSEAKVVVRDASDSGVQLLVPAEVPVPTVVRLEGAEADCFGSTCYCTPYDDQYLVGLHVIRRNEGVEIEQFVT